jgi:hypothetical protein
MIAVPSHTEFESRLISFHLRKSIIDEGIIELEIYKTKQVSDILEYDAVISNKEKVICVQRLQIINKFHLFKIKLNQKKSSVIHKGGIYIFDLLSDYKHHDPMNIIGERLIFIKPKSKILIEVTQMKKDYYPIGMFVNFEIDFLRRRSTSKNQTR